MKLNEKIVYCRKKCGMSQDDLAAKMGVSRQAVSKWETGDSEPEISKLRLMSQVFDVTADWLLSEEQPKDPEPAPELTEHAVPFNDASWLDHLPRFMGNMIKKYGWIYGVMEICSGLVIYAFGYVGQMMFKSAMQPEDMFAADFYAQKSVSEPFNIFFTFVYIIGTVFIIIGAAVILLIWINNKKEAKSI